MTTTFYVSTNLLTQAYTTRKEVAVSLSQVNEHAKTRNIGVITAFCEKLSLEENCERNNELKHRIRSAYGFIKIKGSYIAGKGTPDEREIYEESFLVTAGEGKQRGYQLRAFLKKQGEFYEQESILFKPVESESVILFFTTGEHKGTSVNAGTWRPTTLAEYRSIIKK